jgi:hypothetical protein
MLYVIDQDGLSIIPIKKNDVITVKEINSQKGCRYLVRKERRKRRDGAVVYDWLGTYTTSKETTEVVKRLAAARICSFPDNTFKMPSNGFLGENY